MDSEEEDAFDLENYTVWDDTPLNSMTIDRNKFENAFCPALHGFTPPLELSGRFKISQLTISLLRQDWPQTFSRTVQAYVSFLNWQLRVVRASGRSNHPDDYMRIIGGFKAEKYLSSLKEPAEFPDPDTTLYEWEEAWLRWRGMIRYFQKLEECNEEENPPMLMGANRRRPRHPVHRKNKVFIS